MMRAVVRADASLSIGTGHIMRCLTLASALRGRGADVSFVCREQEGHLCDLVEARGFAVMRIRPTADGWTGGDWQTDAEQTRRAIRGLAGRPDWLIADHYDIGVDWERALRPEVEQIMIIDDLANRVHDCDLLLDQNLVAGMMSRYRGLVDSDRTLLLGPRYALLAPGYLGLHDQVSIREGPIRRILVSFGGSDAPDLTGRTIAALMTLHRPELAVDVVVGATNAHRDTLRAQVKSSSQFVLHESPASLASLMASADLAIGASGGTTWERLCLGLPSLVVSLAENQRPIAATLHEMELVRWLGDATQVTVSAMATAIGELLLGGLPREWSERCRSIVDGRGAARVCAALTGRKETCLRSRRVVSADEALLLKWANDPVTRRNAFSPGSISPDTHRSWLLGRLADWDACHMYIIEAEGTGPVGQVRFDRSGDEWTISYVVAPEQRGRGYGRLVLDHALTAFAADEPRSTVVGFVKPENIPSRRVFEHLAFEQDETPEGFRFRRVL